MKSSLLLTGIGLRNAHSAEFIAQSPNVAWVEVHSENYFCDGGKTLAELEKVRSRYPVSLHGIGLSLGSTDELNWQHLKELKELSARIDPCLVSDHLSWSSFNGQYFHDLLPLPYTEEALLHLVVRIGEVQDYLQRQILIENISSYIQFENSTIPEAEFLQALADQSQCGILLDVNNIYVSAANLGFNTKHYFNKIKPDSVQEIHLAGFTSMQVGDKEVLIDSHSKPIVPAVWNLFREAIAHCGPKPTIIEWDSDLPTLDTLCLEAFRADKILREQYEFAKSAS